MAIDESLRLKIEAELRLGKKPKELSEKYGVPYVTINGWNKKLKAERENAEVDALLEVDESVLHHIADEVKKDAPLPEAKKVEKLVGQVDGLKRLEDKTRELSLSILNQVSNYLALQEEPNMRDLKDAATIVTTIHNAMFNKASTQVNVMNSTTINTEKREIFRANLKA